MKKITTLLLFLSVVSTTYCQIVPVPDSQFKAILLMANATTNPNFAKDLAGNPATIDTNDDNEIQVSEALQISYISTVGLGNTISSFQGIEYFTNLVEFQSLQSQITQIDLSSNVNLTKLDLRNNGLTAIDLTNNNNLNYLDLSYSQISNLGISNLSQLQTLSIYNLPLTTMDFSHHPLLQQVYCTGTAIAELDFGSNPILGSVICGSPMLNFVSIKNGYLNASESIQVSNSPNLTYLCCDEVEMMQLALNFAILLPNCNVGTFCSFNPGGTFYTLSGTTKIDSNLNGCDNSDGSIANLQVEIFGNTPGSFYANSTGNYTIPFQAGSYVAIPKLENPTYFSISPAQINFQFPATASPYNQDFCITPNGVHYDLEVVVTRLKAQIPGADVPYRIVYKNKGNQLQSGTITLNFDDAIMDFVGSNPAETASVPNQLTWNYIDLKPFETRAITFTMNLNSPMEIPALNSGDTIEFTGNIQPDNTAVNDDFPEDNAIAVNFGVINSLDPNDITCLEGNAVGPDKIGKYVHYMIRFENIGTAEAQNVVIKNLIDATRFDIATLVPLYSNYEFVTSQKNNDFEFIFENINLPFDDENNDGYLIYKIKLKNNLVIGDTFTNQANIYFDYNFPIITNIESTLIEQNLSDNDFLSDKQIVIYPNPASDFIHIKMNETTDFGIELYDMVGKQVGNYTNQTIIDISKLHSGMYLVRILDLKNNSESSCKMIKK